jgi:hypothetical protein
MMVECIRLVILYNSSSSSSSWNYQYLPEQPLPEVGSTARLGKQYGTPSTVQISHIRPLSSSQAGQHAVLFQLSIAFGLCGYTLSPSLPAQ